MLRSVFRVTSCVGILSLVYAESVVAKDVKIRAEVVDQGECSIHPALAEACRYTLKLVSDKNEVAGQTIEVWQQTQLREHRPVFSVSQIIDVEIRPVLDNDGNPGEEFELAKFLGNVKGEFAEGLASMTVEPIESRNCETINDEKGIQECTQPAKVLSVGGASSKKRVTLYSYRVKAKDSTTATETRLSKGKAYQVVVAPWTDLHDAGHLHVLLATSYQRVDKK